MVGHKALYAPSVADDEDLAAAVVSALHVAADAGSPVAYRDNEASVPTLTAQRGRATWVRAQLASGTASTPCSQPPA